MDRGTETTEFEVSIGEKYGASKHWFSLDELNDLMVQLAQHFFPAECG